MIYVVVDVDYVSPERAIYLKTKMTMKNFIQNYFGLATFAYFSHRHRRPSQNDSRKKYDAINSRYDDASSFSVAKFGV